jgi:FKBP12-rapamycin complex-associated protein
VATLGLLVENTGRVVQPYLEYPQLLGVLLRMLAEGGPSVRREVMRTLGTIGALDPHAHKFNLAELQGEGRLEREGVRPQFPHKRPAAEQLGERPDGRPASCVATARLGRSGLCHRPAATPPWRASPRH